MRPIASRLIEPRYRGLVVLVGLYLVVVAVVWTVTRPHAPEAVCQPGFAGAVAVSGDAELPLDQQAEYAVRIRACTATIGNAGVLVGVVDPSEGRGVDVVSSDPACRRSHVGATAIVLACGSLNRHEDRQIVLRLAAHPEEDARNGGISAAFSAISVTPSANGALTTVLDSAEVALGVRTATPFWPRSWQWAFFPAIALIAGFDMARRNRSGVRWAVGLTLFAFVGWPVWFRRRLEWEVVPPGAPARHRAMGGVRGRIVGIASALAVVVALFAIGPFNSWSTERIPDPLPTPTVAPVVSASARCGPTPAPPGSAPTLAVDLCQSTAPQTATIRLGETLAVARYLAGVRTSFDIADADPNASIRGESVLVPTGIQSDSALLVLARTRGKATIQATPPCALPCASRVESGSIQVVVV